MDMPHWKLSTPELEITINSKVDELESFEIYTAAALTLIDEADTYNWEKEGYATGDHNPPEVFYERILAAVAHHYAVDNAHLVGMPVHAALAQIIEVLRAQGRLQEPTVGVVSDEDHE